MLDNKQFVRDQFNNFNKHAAYRDVLMLTSFVETSVIEKSGITGYNNNFKQALEKLGLVINKNDPYNTKYLENCVYKEDCLAEINNLRILRNELLHDILKKQLPQKYIHEVIEKMRSNIVRIFNKSLIVQTYFKENYDFDTKDLLLFKWVKP